MEDQRRRVDALSWMSSEVGKKFSKIQYQYVSKMQNQIANVLATMASMMDGPKEDEARLIVLEQKKNQPTAWQ